MNRTTAFYIAGAVASALLWHFFAYIPVVQQTNASQQRLQEAEEQLADFEQTILDLPQYLDTKKRLERFRESLNSRLYAKGDILQLFRRLSLEAGQRKLTVVEITPPLTELLQLNESGSAISAPEFMNVTLDLEGGYVDFGQYVRFVEQADFCHGLNLCEITTGDEKDGMARLRLGFKALLGGGQEGS